MKVPIVLLLLLHYCFGESCLSRKYDQDSIVCVCNVTYCDTLPHLNKSPRENTYQLFTTNKEGLRFQKSSGQLTSDDDFDWSNLFYIAVDSSLSYQTILGFGSSFTDAAGININSLPDAAREKLLNSYFSTDGSEYTLARVPIGGTDFSTHGYSYIDEEGDTLEGFALKSEDYDYKIRNILDAIEITKGSLNLLASAWSSPPWMKENNDYKGALLLTKYYQLWADYYVKFFEEYEKEGITFWGVTTQNEPRTGLIGSAINSIGWTPSLLTTWVNENFGPTIKNSSYSNLKILIHDDQRNLMSNVEEYLNNDITLSYIDGVAVHWYADPTTSPEVLELTKTDKKDVFLLSTEACSGYQAVNGLDIPVRLGSWSRAADYARYTIEDLSYDSVGWIDWNMALDTVGGPTYIDNFVDSTIIVNSTAGEFYKQPMYYALAHFSKYVPPGSVRIEATPSILSSVSGVNSVAFQRPDGAIALILQNEGTEQDIVIKDDIKGNVQLTLSADSINTIVYV